MKCLWLALFMSWLASGAWLSAEEATVPPDPPMRPVRTFTVDDFHHAVGRRGSRGWELDYKRDQAGYALATLLEPAPLGPGLFRATFLLRRGHYPEKGFLVKSYPVFRLEIWDVTEDKRLVDRELQFADFSAPNRYESRWIEFSTRGRADHLIEPRVYWTGLGNGEVASVTLDAFPPVSLAALQRKAQRLGDVLECQNLENGFVVSRKPSGEPDEMGDATTYTGFYVASLAWRYAVTKDDEAYQALENGLETLHNTIKGGFDTPMIARSLDADGAPFPKSPSKDVYTSFFLAYSVAYPHIKNAALREQMRSDLTRLGTRFLEDDLLIKAGKRPLVSLTPYFTDDEVRTGIHKLLSDKKTKQSALRIIRDIRRAVPFHEVWPGLTAAGKAIQNDDAEALFQLVVPTLNGIVSVAARGRDLLKEKYRVDLIPKRVFSPEAPGPRLAELLDDSLKKLAPANGSTPWFQRLSDLKVLASNAILSLHLVRTADVITHRPHFHEYYRQNLYTQDRLLATAEEWYGFEEDAVRLTSGNAAADRERRGYLSLLALYNLRELETNASIRRTYDALLARELTAYRHDDNPLAAAISDIIGMPGDPQIDLVLRDLDEYPEDRTGFGSVYWKDHGKAIADRLAGGHEDGYSREPLPVSHRPKDSFLWQRNTRRLEGDAPNAYPATDYLFVYWMCRYHKLIPATPPEPVAEK